MLLAEAMGVPLKTEQRRSHTTVSSFRLDNSDPALIYKAAIRLAIINKSGTQSIEEW
jgi:hypothetical protein